MTPGDRLREARLKAGYTVAADAARKAGVKPVTFRAHESGQNEFDRETAEEYARAFGVKAEWLLLGRDDGKLEPAEIRLLGVFRELEPDQREHIQRTAEMLRSAKSR